MWHRLKLFFVAALGFMVPICMPTTAQDQGAIPPGSKVYVAPMEGGFEAFLKAALLKKKVPLQLVEEGSHADFEIIGHAESQKLSWLEKIYEVEWRSKEGASIVMTNLKTGEVVFGYAVHKGRSAHGRRSTAEACAKHLKKKIEGK